MILSESPRLRLETIARAVELATLDVTADFARVFGDPSESAKAAAELVVAVDSTLGAPESWRLRVSDGVIEIHGADVLGAVFGLYEFSRRFLGVDPYWFWKDFPPESCTAINLPFGEWRSTPAVFSYRGWFLNDEDLLTEWHEGGAPRRIDYPFYQKVITPEIIDRVCEALLRAGGNLLIPGSVINILEPSERMLIERTVARGLYVSQHHIEPLGLSHFSFETYWRDRGENVKLAYATDPGRVRLTWRIYAEEWAKIAGDRVVWQLGLRGRGDRPVWHNDTAIAEAQAGAFISQALAEQMAIIREVDQRPVPPTTLTLWEEGSHLMAAGCLTLPLGTTAVFCDRGASQTMQEDFYQCPRDPNRAYGVYYHLAYWGSGPHLAQGVPPAKIHDVYSKIIAKGDTAYSMVNVANVREFTVGLTALMEIVREGAQGWSIDVFWVRTLPAPLRPLYERYYAAILDLRLGDHQAVIKTLDLDARPLTDGEARQMINQLVSMHRDSAHQFPSHMFPAGCDSLPAAARALHLAADVFSCVARDAEAAISTHTIPECWHAFVSANLVVHARTMSGLYACNAGLIDAFADRSALAISAEAIALILRERESVAKDQWREWYRGDKKSNLATLYTELRSLRS